MESTNLTTRTYTAPTCRLVVNTKAPLLPNLTHLKKPHAVDFKLHLGQPEQLESERIEIEGNPQQLEQLQQSVSKYVADLVAKFPLPTQETEHPAAGQSIDSAVDRLHSNPEERANVSGFTQNLAGLRNNSPQSTPESDVDSPPSSPLSTKNISRLLGLRNSANPQSEPVALTPTPERVPTPTPATPYLTGGDRSLDHQLHLGELATSISGAVLTLSAIQLFDLATTLDEYAAEVVTPKPVESTTTKPVNPVVAPTTATSPPGIGASNTASPQAPAPVAALNTPLSRLPNLPKAPATPSRTAPTYDYANGGSGRPAFMSVIPWAAAAALAVGVPLLLFGPKSNSLKELTSNIKLPANVKLPAFKAPDFEAAKKSVMSQLPGQEPAPTDLTTSPVAAVPNGPKPWEQQPVQPPKTPAIAAKIPGAQMPIAPDKIGIAPLPPSIGDSVGQAVPSRVPSRTLATKPASIAQSTTAPNITKTTKSTTTTAIPTKTERLTDIAPNPLSSPSLPPQLSSPPIVTQQPARSTISNPVTTLPVSPAKIATAPKIVKPKAANIQSGKVSIAKQPLAMPPDLSASKINSAAAGTTIPFSAPEIQVAERVNPAPLKPTVAKKVTKAKPPIMATKPKAKTPKPTTPVLTPQPVVEQFKASPNPNLIDPIPPTSGEGASLPQNPPAFPEQQLPVNIGRSPNAADPFDTPSLKETKRFFQGKWQADPSQSNSYQYVVRINGKSGLVQTVNPQGEPATEYLKKTKLIEPGDKLMSPAAAANKDQKIRVVLQPDGTVDAFGEP